jgi:hypothetical protein
MAITIIPIPPSHCRIALHNNIPLGVFSKFEIIVEPVVVIPDILSKKASVIDNSIVENIKGSDPNTAILSQDRAVNKKACCKFNFLSWSKFDKKNNIPKIIVTMDDPKNEESISE